MIRFYAIALMAALSACSDSDLAFDSEQGFDPPQIDLMAVNAAVTDAKRYLGSGATALVVCTGSDGKTYFLNDPRVEDDKESFVKDGIADGVIIFARTPSGAPEILTRDFGQELIVASEDGGRITRHETAENDGSGMWLLTFPSTGVTINYNLSRNERGELVNLWTQNKPAVSQLPSPAVLPPRASIFKSMCEAIQ